MEIRFELSFEVPATYTRLNYGLERLSDTLVLRLLGGKDIFITVTGDYRPSAFGCLLETLISLHDRPMADVDSPKELAKLGGGGEPWDEAVRRALDPLRSAKQQQQVGNKSADFGVEASSSAPVAVATATSVPVDLLIDLSFDDPPIKKTPSQQLLELVSYP